MSAIKLPLVAETIYGGAPLWRVVDANNWIVSSMLSEQEAKQIATSLNMHDELVSELTRLRDVVGESDFELIGKILEKANP